MKPQTLTLQAFQSFAGALTVHFDDLARDGLFAIVGETGAGKTSILDALVYALYGELPGTRRQDDVRSDLVGSDIETFVRLAFEANGEAWTIERKPPQTRAKKTGSGDRAVQAERTLWPTATGKTGGGALTSDVEVKAAIQRLIGLNCDEFNQVVLLPQNDFQKVLVADARDRAPLLRKLFSIELYDSFAKALGGEASLRKASVQEAKIQLKTALDDIRRTQDELCGLLAISPPGAPVPVLPDGSLNAHAVDVDEELAHVEKIEESLGLLETTSREAEGTASAAQGALETGRLLVGRFDELDGLSSEKRALADTQGADEALKALVASYRAVEPYREVLGKWRSANSDLAEAQAELRTETTVVEESRPSFAKWRTASRSTSLLSLHERLKGHLGPLEELSGLNEGIATRSQLIDSGRGQVTASVKQMRELTQKLEAAQVAVVALRLQDGEPCPVCGSADHPSPAVSDDGMAELSMLQAAAEALSERLTKEQNDVAAAEGEQRALSERRDELLSELKADIRCDASSPFNDMRLDLGTYVTAQARLLDAMRAEEDAETRRAECLKSLAKAMRRAGATSPEDLMAILAQVDEGMAESPDDLEEQLQTRQQERATIEHRLQSLASELKDRIRPDLQELQCQWEEADRASARLLRLKTTAEVHVRRIREDLARIQRALEDFSRKEQAWDECAGLYGVIAGTDTRDVREGASRQSLAEWLLAGMFAEVLDQANSRLRKMDSMSHYELRPHSDDGERQRRAALDIEVLDARSGKQRKARSLSGGEKFQAALALALGLADVVSQSQNKDLEALFIDEGFGSLDPQSLESVLRELGKLQRAGSRMVGIISHVGELRGKVASYVEVIKGPDGTGSIVRHSTNGDD